MKGGWAYGNKLSMVITINLNSRSVAYIRRKLLKRLIPKNVASIQIQKVAIFNSDRKKNLYRCTLNDDFLSLGVV